MDGLNTLLTRVVVISVVAGVLPIFQCFNVDVERAVVHKGPRGTAFGYKAEFITIAGTVVSLLVTAPNTTASTQENSGKHYFCEPADSEPCEDRFSAFQKDSKTTQGTLRFPAATTDGKFGEKDEKFGLALTLADNKTALMCGPLFIDLRFEQKSSHSFTIGRCQWSPNPNSSQGPSPYADFPVENYVINGLMAAGMSMFGFAAAGDGNGKVVVSAPYWKNGQGDVFVFDSKTRGSMKMGLSLSSQSDIYNGFEVAIGKFCKGNTVCFATANREASGKVYLIQHDPTSRQPFQLLGQENGTQTYSSFGSALCAMDVNGDGWSDLLVGAPTFTADVNGTMSYDQGRVYVLISFGDHLVNQKNFRAGATLSGSEVEFSRFGSAIGNIGDINRDSLDDIAVGAPLENQGSGALYIYLSSPDGPVNKPVQKILGQQFTPTLTSFGSHISKSTSSISSYGYPDFAVGAPLSDAVVFLQTRLIVNAQVDIKALPNPVDPAHQICPPIPELARKGCVQIEFCINFTHGAERRVDRTDFNTLQFDLDIEVDRRISSQLARRLQLYIDADGTTTTYLNLTKTVTATGRVCQNVTALLRQEQINKNPFEPLEVEVKFRLNTTKFSTGPSPILNQSRPDSHIYVVKFKFKCGTDDKCQADLNLSGKVQHLPALESKIQNLENQEIVNVINHTSWMEMSLLLRNNGEKAFGMNLTVNVSGIIPFRTVTSNTTFLCNDGNQQNPTESTVEGSVIAGATVTQPSSGGTTALKPVQESRQMLICRSWAPLGEGEAAEIRLQFLAGSVPLVAENKAITFVVKAMPSDTNSNPEVKEEDNKLLLESRTAIIADLKITGWSDPRVQHVQDSDRGNVTLTHKLLLTNNGPSFLPPTLLNVTLPVSSVAGNDLVGSANVTFRMTDGKVLECPEVHISGSVVDPSSPTTTTATTTTTTTRAPTTTRSDGELGGSTTDDPFGTVKPAKRLRRDAADASDRAANDAESGTDRAANDAESGTVEKKIDCSTHICRMYQCSLPTLQPNAKLELNVTVTLLRNGISFPEKVDTLLYATTTGVTQPNHPLFHSWDTKRILEVVTPLRKVGSADEVNILYIILGVIGGLVLLAIIAIIAWKAGFFKRNDKKRLEKLKRQSGFYENKQSSRRSKRASTSGSQRSAGSTGSKSKPV